jgi:hypothetical protein
VDVPFPSSSVALLKSYCTLFAETLMVNQGFEAAEHAFVREEVLGGASVTLSDQSFVHLLQCADFIGCDRLKRLLGWTLMSELSEMTREEIVLEALGHDEDISDELMLSILQAASKPHELI